MPHFFGFFNFEVALEMAVNLVFYSRLSVEGLQPSTGALANVASGLHVGPLPTALHVVVECVVSVTRMAPAGGVGVACFKQCLQQRPLALRLDALSILFDVFFAVFLQISLPWPTRDSAHSLPPASPCTVFWGWTRMRPQTTLKSPIGKRVLCLVWFELHFPGTTACVSPTRPVGDWDP